MIATLTTASSAPGATTLALALTLAWPRPAILLEANLGQVSAILPGYYAGGTPAGWGLTGLVLAAQDGSLAPETLRAQSQEIGPDKRVIPGLAMLGQADGARQYMGDIAALMGAISSAGTDVIIDAGRCSSTTPRDIFAASDVVAVVTGSRLPDMIAARSLAPSLAATPDSVTTTGVIAVRPGQPFPADEVASVAQLPLIGSIPDDATAAAHLSTGADFRGYDRSRLAGAAASLAIKLVSTNTQARERLGLDSTRSSDDLA